jgi:phosphohistidine phosphatase SixA
MGWELGVIVLVRHAHAGRRDAWTGEDDFYRPLSERGLVQAKVLADRLIAHGITRAFTSPYVRCVQTLIPFADTAAVRMEELDTLREGAAPTPLFDLVGQDGVGTVVCSHGDVLGRLVSRLASEGAPIDPTVPIKKGSAWWLETAAGSVVSARYTPAEG